MGGENFGEMSIGVEKELGDGVMLWCVYDDGVVEFLNESLNGFLGLSCL